MLRALTCLCSLWLFCSAPSSLVLARSGAAHAGFDIELDALAFLPEPPALSSALFLHDKELYELGKSMRDSERASQSARDADQRLLPGLFSEAFGCSISQETLPVLYAFLKRVRKSFGKSVRRVKKAYQRQRPYALYGDATCYPETEAVLSRQSSYPSGHSVQGWGMALVLSEINPERAEQILARGLQFGQSRVICGYHWQSDVDAGRLLASAIVARLHANAVFLAELEAAKLEFARWQKEQKP